MKLRPVPRLGLVSLDQLDPHGRDGASLDILARLRFLYSQGFHISILNFLFPDRSRLRVDKRFAGPDLIFHEENGLICRISIYGLDYFQYILPYRFEDLSCCYQDIQKHILKTIRQSEQDYVFTIDEGYIPLLASWLLGIPGAHMFFSLSNVINFSRNSTCLRFLRSREVLSNSRFIQREINVRLGLEAMLWLPFMDFERCGIGPKTTRTFRLGFSAKGQGESNRLIIEVARRLPEQDIIVAGEGFYSSDTIPSNVKYVGHLTDMKEFYREIDVLLVPSSDEAFSLASLEAFTNGLPVVANRVGGIPEALGGSGILIDVMIDKNGDWEIPKMAEKYAETIRRFMADGDFYGEHSRRAMARSEEYRVFQERMSYDIIDRCILPSIARKK